MDKEMVRNNLKGRRSATDHESARMSLQICKGKMFQEKQIWCI